MAAIQTALSGRWLKSLFTTTGDIAYASGASTPARLAVGSTGNVLTVAGGVPTWAPPASTGGMTLLTDTTVTGSVLASFDTNVLLGGNIPATYKHLKYVISARGDNAASSYVACQANGDTGANYINEEIAQRSAVANYAATSGASAVNVGYMNPSTDTANVFAGSEGTVFDYLSTAKNKSFHGTSVAPGSAVQAWNGTLGGGWNSTSAITRLVFKPSGVSNFAIGSRFTLWGLS